MDNKIDNRIHLYGWLFTYNPYTGHWIAFTKDNYIKAMNESEENFLRSKSRDTLEEIIIKCEGEVTDAKLFKIVQ